jgi:hypothetical protein
MKNIVKVSALLLCVLFFTLPLVQCSNDNSLTASCWEIATGTGDLFSQGGSGYPLAFLLILIPVVLLLMAFIGMSFAVLRNISIAGLLAEIIFLIYANSLLNSGEYRGAFELTGFNWLILFIYIGLFGFTFYCAKKGGDKVNIFSNVSGQNIVIGTTKKCPFCANEIKIEAIVCQFCGKDLPDNIPTTIISNSSNDLKQNISGMVVASLVLGILSILALSNIPIGILLNSIGIPLSIVGRSKLKMKGESTLLGTISLILNIVVLSLTIILLGLFVLAMQIRR